MLDDNTNKLVWVSIALGIVATLGTGTMTLFPQATSIGQQAIHKTIDSFTSNSTNKGAMTSNSTNKEVLTYNYTGEELTSNNTDDLDTSMFYFGYDQKDMTASVTGVKRGKEKEKADIIIPKWVIIYGKKYRVTTIGCAFCYYNRKNVTINSVVLPDGLTTIENFAFEGQNLTSIYIPDSVTTIEHHAFANNKIKSGKLPKNIPIIGDYAFYNNKIENLELPNTVKYITSGGKFDNNPLKTVRVSKNISKDFVFSNNPIVTKY